MGWGEQRRRAEMTLEEARRGEWSRGEQHLQAEQPQRAWRAARPREEVAVGIERRLQQHDRTDVASAPPPTQARGAIAAWAEGTMVGLGCAPPAAWRCPPLRSRATARRWRRPATAVGRTCDPQSSAGAQASERRAFDRWSAHEGDRRPLEPVRARHLDAHRHADARVAGLWRLHAVVSGEGVRREGEMGGEEERKRREEKAVGEGSSHVTGLEQRGREVVARAHHQRLERRRRRRRRQRRRRRDARWELAPVDKAAI